ncbi:MAG: thiamine phosphate synthase [Lachnospiraceae bacterium]|nr:thiamine phosphate synthase [Lachnospiraceae bacterium]
MKCDRSHMLLYAVTDRSWLNGKTLYENVEKALKGGATCLQLREKELGYDEFLKEAFEIKKLCAKYHVPFIINDSVDIAIACEADGIHVGQSDMDALNVREKVGLKMIVGVSVQTVDQALKAQKSGADYLGVGAAFSTSTKLDADTVSHETMRQICKAVSIPVVAIGGINKQNIKELKGTRVDGVAVISAIFAKEDIEAETRELLRLSSQIEY